MQRLFKIFDKLNPAEVFIIASELNRPQLWKDYECLQQINFALEQLNKGKRVTELCRRMEIKYAISMRTARRRVAEALGHPSRYSGANTQYHDPIINKFQELIVMGFIPSKIARRHFMADAIQGAGFSPDFSKYIARLIPDIIVFNAVFVNFRPVSLEIINHNHCFIRIDDKLIYIGRPISTTDIDDLANDFIYANLPDIEILAMSDEEALNFDPTQLILESANRFPTVKKWHDEAPSKVCVDLRTHLKEFVEVSDDA